MEDLYSILKIDKKASNKEIKDSYMELLRLYLLEKNKVTFYKVRESYEILSNEKTRKEYDNFIEYGTDITRLNEDAEYYISEGNLKKAIINYKKILLFDRNLNYIKNKLALLLLYNGETEKASEIFLELLEYDANNPIFNYNIGMIYMKKGDYIKSEKYLSTANRLDPINYDIESLLIQVYIKQKKYKETINFLERCIGKYERDEFRKFIYYNKMMEIYLIMNDAQSSYEIVEEIISFTTKDMSVRNYILQELKELERKLYDFGEFDLGKKICERIKKFEHDKIDVSINQLYADYTIKHEDKKCFQKYSSGEIIKSPLKKDFCKKIEEISEESNLFEKNKGKIDNNNISYGITKGESDYTDEYLENLKIKNSNMIEEAKVEILECINDSNSYSNSYSSKGIGCFICIGFIIIIALISNIGIFRIFMIALLVGIYLLLKK